MNIQDDFDPRKPLNLETSDKKLIIILKMDYQKTLSLI